MLSTEWTEVKINPYCVHVIRVRQSEEQFICYVLGCVTKYLIENKN